MSVVLRLHKSLSTHELDVRASVATKTRGNLDVWSKFWNSEQHEWQNAFLAPAHLMLLVSRVRDTSNIEI